MYASIHRNNLCIMLIDIVLAATVQILWNSFVRYNVLLHTPPVESVYLDFDNLPETNFSCSDKVIGGYYADVETGCQMFHVCTLGQKAEISDIKFLCLNGTVFDQQTRVCEREEEVDCSRSETFYSINLDLYGNRGNNVPLYRNGIVHDNVIENVTSNLSNNSNNAIQKPLPHNGAASKLNSSVTMITPNLYSSLSSGTMLNENSNFVTRSNSYSNLPAITFVTTTDNIIVPTIEETSMSSVNSPTSDIVSQLLVLHETFKQNLQNYNVSEKLLSQNINRHILNTSDNHYPLQLFSMKTTNRYPFSRIHLPTSLNGVIADHNVNNLITNSSYHPGENKSYQILYSPPDNDNIKYSRAVKINNMRDINKYGVVEQLLSSTSQHNHLADKNDSKNRSHVNKSLSSMHNDQYQVHKNIQDSNYNDYNYDDYENTDSLEEIITTLKTPLNSQSKITDTNYKSNTLITPVFMTTASDILPSFNVVGTTHRAIIGNNFDKVKSDPNNNRYNVDKLGPSISRNGTEKINASNTMRQGFSMYDGQEEDYYYY